ncbi:TIR domain-containing protein [Hwangdonia sp.]|uniref:TIR domain-containing protein n=1 Tax=Hwangdonia sp. TaxID=1883432 RepID=UPI003AB7DFF4
MKVFISYSHQDEKLKDELLKQLAGFKRRNIIDLWHDRKIIPGQKWGKEIDKYLTEADIILLLISPDFIASEYCNDIELKTALSRHDDENDPALVIPVILRPCLWEQEQFGSIECLPTKGKPVMSWGTTDEAFTDVAIGLTKVFDNRKKQVSNVVYNKSLSNILSEPDTNTPILESYKFDCNRTKQGETFKEHFYDSSHKSLLQFSFICGDENQQVDSFFYRIYLEVLSDYANESIKSITIKEAHYPTFKFGNTLKGSINKFRRILERNIQLEAGEKLKNNFCSHEIINLNAIKPFKYLVIEFKVYSHDCFKTNHGADFVNWLLNDFFQTNIKCATDTKIVFFFCLIFNHKRNLFHSITSKKSKLINKIVKSVDSCEIFDTKDEVSQIFCKMDELESVDNIELQAWFSKFYRNSETVKNTMVKVFGPEDKKRTMSVIEPHLHKIIDHFLNKENEITR